MREALRVEAENHLQCKRHLEAKVKGSRVVVLSARKGRVLNVPKDAILDEKGDCGALSALPVSWASDL